MTNYTESRSKAIYLPKYLTFPLIFRVAHLNQVHYQEWLHNLTISMKIEQSKSVILANNMHNIIDDKEVNLI